MSSMDKIKIEFKYQNQTVTVSNTDCQPCKKDVKKNQKNKKFKNGLYGLTVSNTDCQKNEIEEKRTGFIWGDSIKIRLYIYIYLYARGFLGLGLALGLRAGLREVLFSSAGKCPGIRT